MRSNGLRIWGSHQIKDCLFDKAWYGTTCIRSVPYRLSYCISSADILIWFCSFYFTTWYVMFQSSRNREQLKLFLKKKTSTIMCTNVFKFKRLTTYVWKKDLDLMHKSWLIMAYIDRQSYQDWSFSSSCFIFGRYSYNPGLVRPD